MERTLANTAPAALILDLTELTAVERTAATPHHLSPIDVCDSSELSWFLVTFLPLLALFRESSVADFTFVLWLEL